MDPSELRRNLDEGLKPSQNVNFDAKDLQITFELKILGNTIGKKEGEKQGLNKDKIWIREVKECDEGLLRHPLIEAYLHMKWNLVKWAFIANVAGYSFFTLMLTLMSMIAVSLNQCKEGKTYGKLNCGAHSYLNTTNFWEMMRINLNIEGKRHHKAAAFYALFVLMLLGYFYHLAREVLQAKYAGIKSYFLDKSNWLDSALIFLTTCTIISTFIDKDSVIMFESWAVFMAWINMIHLLSELPSIGRWIFLLLRIMVHLFKFMMVFLPLLIAFALKFHLSLHNQAIFSNFNIIPKMLDMMVGELTYDERFFNASLAEISPDSKESYKNIREVETNVIFILFLLLVNVLLTNVLTALSVNVNDKFSSRADVMRLASIVDQVEMVEKLNGIHKVLVRFFLSSDCLEEIPESIVVKPNEGSKPLSDPDNLNSTSFRELRVEVEFAKSKRTFKMPALVVFNAIEVLKKEKERKDALATIKENQAILKGNQAILKGLLAILSENDKKSAIEDLKAKLDSIENVEK